jgi:arylsulfatase A-like enzyme
MNAIVIVCDTLKRDHVGAYNHGKPLNECWSQEAPDWKIPTPNMDRLAGHGTVFDQCYCGSTPCMPARRDIYTGNYEFLWRGWGPLEEEDLDLPRQISGPPNQSIQRTLELGHNISYLVTDHFHLWEKGAGNYHMGYTGFDFIRGMEADAWYTEPEEFACPEQDRISKLERHWRNVKHIRSTEDDWFAPKVFGRAADWLDKNCSYDDFYLHIDSFEPHEPLDPPEDILKQFDPKGYDMEGWSGAWPYAKWKDLLTDEQFNSFRARYAAKVVLLDKALGKLLSIMDKHDLWKNTMVILTTDHGTFNGDHGRTGKLQTHEFDAKSHIPFIVAHPEGRGERCQQLVQLIDVYPTVLAVCGKEIPENVHGVNLLPVLKDNSVHVRDYAISGMFGYSVSITDGEWTLHQSPVESNKPLNWYSPYLAKFIHYDLGPYDNGKREVFNQKSWPEGTWLSNKKDDPNELNNLAEKMPDKVLEMRRKLKRKLEELKAPVDQIIRLGLENI